MIDELRDHLVAADYQVSIVGEHADELQSCIEAAKAGAH